MGQWMKNVKLHLKTTIDDKGDIETHNVITSGLFSYRQSMDVLTFSETTNEEKTIKNLLTISPYKVSLKRSGAVSMHQQFIIHETHECMYKHPYGFMYMETYTNSISYQTLRSNDFGRLLIDYTVSLNQQANREHQLLLTFYEEDD